MLSGFSYEIKIFLILGFIGSYIISVMLTKNTNVVVRKLRLIYSLSIYLSSIHFLGLIFGLRFGICLSFVFTTFFSMYFVTANKSFGYGKLLKFDLSFLRRQEYNSLFYGAFFVLAITYSAIVEYDFYDKVTDFGHFSTTNSILNGNYPPLNLVTPSLSYNYLFGINLLGALFADIFGLTVPVSYKILTFSSIAYVAIIISHATCISYNVKKTAFVIPIVLCMSGGIGFLISSGQPYYTLGYWVTEMPPHNIASYFQAPWILGIPGFFSLIILFREYSISRSFSIILLMMSILIMLTFTQEIVALVLSGAFLGASLLKYVYNRHSGLKETNSELLYFSSIFLIVIFVVAFSMDVGFLNKVNIENSGSGSIELRPSLLAGTLVDTLVWNFSFYGISLFLVVGYFAFVGRVSYSDLPVLIVFFGCTVIANSLFYTKSWDIVKFSTVALLSLSFSSIHFYQYLSDFRPRVLYILILPLLIIQTLSAFLFLSRFIIEEPSEHQYKYHYLKNNPVMDYGDDLKKVIDYFRFLNVDTPILINKEDSSKMMVLGGLPQFNPNMIFSSLFVNHEVITKRNEITQ